MPRSTTFRLFSLPPFCCYLLLRQSFPCLKLYLDKYGTFVLSWVVIVSRHSRYSTPEPLALRSQRFCVSFPASGAQAPWNAKHFPPFCFQLLTHGPFCSPFVFTFMHVTGGKGVFAVFRLGLTPDIDHFSVNSFRLILFRALLHSQKAQPLSFQAIPHSLRKTTRGGGTPAFLHEDQNEPSKD